MIYGYGKPVYISFTHKPLGILIIIYEDGVAVDLEIIKQIDTTDNKYFHTDDIKTYYYIRDEVAYKEFTLRDDQYYQISRLFHRSLIKFLSGKRDLGVSIANEIAIFANSNLIIDKHSYKNNITCLLRSFNGKCSLPISYFNILCELIDKIREIG